MAHDGLHFSGSRCRLDRFDSNYSMLPRNTAVGFHLVADQVRRKCQMFSLFSGQNKHFLNRPKWFPLFRPSVALASQLVFIGYGRTGAMKRLFLYEFFSCSAIVSPTRAVSIIGRVITECTTNFRKQTRTRTMPHVDSFSPTWVGFSSKNTLPL